MAERRGLVPYQVGEQEVILAHGMRVSHDARVEHAILTGEGISSQLPKKEKRMVAVGGNTSERNLQTFVGYVQPDRPIAIVTTPTTLPQEQFEGYRDRFRTVGSEAEPFHIGEHTLPFEARAMMRLSGGVWGTGGDQERGRQLLVEKGLDRELIATYESGKVVGGTSAGAHMLSEITSINRELPDGRSVTEEILGIGIVKGVSFETHNDRRLRKYRQDKLVSEVHEIGKDIVSIGLPESGGVVFDQKMHISSIDDKTKTIVWQRNGVVDDTLLRSNDMWIDVKRLPRAKTFYSFTK